MADMEDISLVSVINRHFTIEKRFGFFSMLTD